MSAAAEYAKSHKSPLVPLLATFDTLVAAGDYRGFAEAFEAFIKEHGTTRYLSSEPVPFKIADHLAKKFGSSALTTFTLRNTTWTSDLTKALNVGPDAFAAFVADVEAKVAEIASTTKKLS